MTLEDCLALFPGAGRGKPRFTALCRAVLRQAADLVLLTEQLHSAFTVPCAEGNQLDALAESMGVSRPAGAEDEAFRAFLRAKLALWTWDGTNEGVPAALSALPGAEVRDNMDGTVTVTAPALPGPAEEVLPVPAGIGIII